MFFFSSLCRMALKALHPLFPFVACGKKFLIFMPFDVLQRIFLLKSPQK